MRFFRGVFAPVLCLMVLVGGKTQAADVDKAKIVGSWQMILPEDAKIDLKVIITFANDGKAIMSFEGFGKKENKEGTWKLDGDKITITPKDEKEKTETITVKSVTADKLTLSDKSGKDMEFKKTVAPKPVAFEPETLTLARAVADEPKGAIEAAKLLGKWKAPDGKSEIEFAKEGKLILTAEGIKIEGKYKLEKDKLTVIISFGGKEDSETMTVKSITDTKLVTVDSKGKQEELTRTK
jgi:uncharacterized protein (TIGR03066 family)